MLDRGTLVRENQQCLQQAIDLLEQITDELYSNNDGPHFMSGVGKHIRHILDFYANFLAGWNTQVDYDARKREPRLEKDRRFCVQNIREIMEALNDLPVDVSEPSKLLPVKNDEIGQGDGDALFCHSTLKRELQFLKFHAVHHYAMIVMILRIQGFEPPEDFGFAPSTLEYLKKLKIKDVNDQSPDG